MFACFLASCAGPDSARYPTQIQSTCMGLDGLPVLPISAAIPDLATFRAQCCGTSSRLPAGCPQVPSSAVDYKALGLQIARSQTNIRNALDRIFLVGQEKAAADNAALRAQTAQTRARLANYSPVPPPSVARSSNLATSPQPTTTGTFTTTSPGGTSEAPPGADALAAQAAQAQSRSYLEGARAAGAHFAEQMKSFANQLTGEGPAPEAITPPTPGTGTSAAARSSDSEPTPAGESVSTSPTRSVATPTWQQFRIAPGQPDAWLRIPRGVSVVRLADPHYRGYGRFLRASAEAAAPPPETPPTPPITPPATDPVLPPALPSEAPPENTDPSAEHPAPGRLFVPQ